MEPHQGPGAELATHRGSALNISPNLRTMRRRGYQSPPQSPVRRDGQRLQRLTILPVTLRAPLTQLESNGTIPLPSSNDRCYAVCYGRLPRRLKAFRQNHRWDSLRFGQVVRRSNTRLRQMRRKNKPTAIANKQWASCEPLFSTAGPNIDWIGTYVWQIRNWNYYSNHFRGYD